MRLADIQVEDLIKALDAEADRIAGIKEDWLKKDRNKTGVIYGAAFASQLVLIALGNTLHRLLPKDGKTPERKLDLGDVDGTR